MKNLFLFIIFYSDESFINISSSNVSSVKKSVKVCALCVGELIRGRHREACVCGCVLSASITSTRTRGSHRKGPECRKQLRKGTMICTRLVVRVTKFAPWIKSGRALSYTALTGYSWTSILLCLLIHQSSWSLGLLSFYRSLKLYLRLLLISGR